MVKMAGEVTGTKSDFEMIVRIADAMGADVRKLVPFGGPELVPTWGSRAARNLVKPTAMQYGSRRTIWSSR